MQPYFVRRTEITVLDGCLLWGSRAVVPPAGRSLIMNELHDIKNEVSRMKSLARSFVWWPNIDSDIEEKVKSCAQCQQHQNVPSKAPLHPWQWPERPWCRLHIDFAGPCFGDRYFLIVVDAHSKWLDVVEARPTSESTILRLQTMFATHGLPEIVVSDNGPAFMSEIFADFMSQNGIRHNIFISPSIKWFSRACGADLQTGHEEVFLLHISSMQSHQISIPLQNHSSPNTGRTPS